MTSPALSGRWAALLIFGTALLAYLPAIRGGFVWNDRDYVTEPALRPVSGLGRIWGEVGATEQYYPALHTAFWIEHRLWGDAPVGYHLVNVLLHASAACLFALFLARLGVPGAWLAGLIFALHPVAVESVAWISEQKNTLSAAAYLLAALAYLRFDESRKTRWYLAALGGFVLALLSKSVTATLPAALLVVFWWRRGRLSWKADVLPLLPWFALGAADGLFTAWVEHTYVGAKGGDFGLTLAQRGLVAGHAVWFYLGKLFWPADLIFIYPRWVVDPSSPGLWLFPAGLVMVVAGLWLLRHRTRAPLAALLFFVGSLFPVLGFFNVFAFVFSFVADHFQYLASMGIIALVAAGWAGWRIRGGPVIAALVLGLLGILTWRQCRMYGDVFTFYRTILERNPAAWMAHQNLGVALAESGRGSEAIGEYEAALQLKPDNALGEYDLGLTLYAQGQIPAAMTHYERALRLEPAYVRAHYALGLALVKSGRPAEAIPHYRAALQGDPRLAPAHEGLGGLLMAGGRPAEAAEEFRQAVLLDPDNPQAQQDFGSALVQSGRAPEAITHFARAVELDPANAESHYNLGVALAQSDRLPEAIGHFAEAVRLQPSNLDAQVNLALALAEAGRTPEAIAQCQAALRLNPGFGPARELLARLQPAAAR